MKQFSKELGKVSITPKGAWNSNITNERLDIVYDKRNNQAYIAKQNVPVGVDIDNREYWQPLNVSGYADNNFINLTTENENGTITAFESIDEAIAAILPINRRAGATLSFYNLNSDRLDRQAEFELWQFNSTDLANWENKNYWNNIYYNWNVFAGWYISVDSLENHVKIPNVGQYAYVGTNLNDALLYQCRTNGTWTNTGIKVRNYISVVVSGNITIGENGNWFSNGEDTGIPATPDVDEQLDNIIIQLQQHTTEISNLKKSDADLQDQITSNDSDITDLTARHESLSKTVQGIAATGGASTATNVTYDKTNSGLNVENAQDAIDALSKRGYNFKGLAKISTTPDGNRLEKAFYIANKPGEYINFHTSSENTHITIGEGLYMFTKEANSNYWKADALIDIAQELIAIKVTYNNETTGLEAVNVQKAIDEVVSDLSSMTQDIRSVIFEGKGIKNMFSYPFKKGMHLIFDVKNEGETPADSIFFKKDNTTVFHISIQALANNGEFKIILPCDIDLISLSSGSMEYTIRCEIMSRNEQMINEAVSSNDFYFSGNIPSNGISKIPFDISEGEEFYIDLVHKGSAKIGVSDGVNVYLKNNGYGKFIAKKDINVLNLFNDTHETDLIEFSLSRYSIKQDLANIDRTVVEVSDKLSSKGAAIGNVLTSNGDGTSTWKEPLSSGGNGCSAVTIAAYNAKTKSKAHADFICTGTNDDEIINQAIQSLSAEGGEIKLTDGLFLISSPILIDRRIKITGEGYGICGIPQYTPTDSECKYENLYGSNVGITTIRCTADIDVIRIYSESKLQGIQLRDFVIQGYGKDRHTKSGISIETDTDVFYMTGVGIYDCHVGFYSHGHNMDAPNIIYNSFQWCACGAIVQAVFGRFVGNCIADNNGIKEYKGLTVNTGGLAISGSAMSILDNQFVRTERYTIPKDGRKFDENLLGSSLSLGYYTDFTNDKKKECGNFIVANNTINQNGGNGIRLLFANFTNISNNNITTYGLSKMDGFKCGISGDKLGANTIILGNKIGNPSADNITAYQGVNLKCTYGNNLVCNNMFTWLSGSSVTCGNSASNNTISNNIIT